MLNTKIDIGGMGEVGFIEFHHFDNDILLFCMNYIRSKDGKNYTREHASITLPINKLEELIVAIKRHQKFSDKIIKELSDE